MSAPVSSRIRRTPGRVGLTMTGPSPGTMPVTRSGRLNNPVLKASTISATTPTAKIRRQNRNVYRWTGFAAFQCIPCRTHGRIESPTVIAGNVMWNITLRWRTATGTGRAGSPLPS